MPSMIFALSLFACNEREDPILALEIRVAQLEQENSMQAEALSLVTEDGQVLDLVQRMETLERAHMALAQHALGPDDLAGYATQDWVKEQGFASHKDLDSLVLFVADVERSLVDTRVRMSEAEQDAVRSQEGLTSVEGRVSTLEDSADTIAGAKELLAYVSVSGGDVVFSGTNVYIQSGSGSTAGALNGLGNLVIGYDEDDGADDKSGSHNLILGAEHSYSSYGGLVQGQDNSAQGLYNVVLGQGNSTEGEGAMALGGYSNAADQDHALVLGGSSNQSSGEAAVVMGGSDNVASGDWAVVSGGQDNHASGAGSSISGGYDHFVSGVNASASGGVGGEVTGDYASLSGGLYGVVSGKGASLLGGYYGEAIHAGAVVLGGNGAVTKSSYDIAF